MILHLSDNIRKATKKNGFIESPGLNACSTRDFKQCLKEIDVSHVVWWEDGTTRRHARSQAHLHDDCPVTAASILMRQLQDKSAALFEVIKKY